MAIDTSKFVGKWNLVNSENFDEYMKEVGVGLMTRKIGGAVKPVLDIEVNGEHWKITSTSTFKTFSIEFDLGKEFEETTADGRKMKSSFHVEGDKLIQDQKKIDSKDKNSKFERYLEDGKLVITMETETGVKSKRVYERA